LIPPLEIEDSIATLIEGQSPLIWRTPQRGFCRGAVGFACGEGIRAIVKLADGGEAESLRREIAALRSIENLETLRGLVPRILYAAETPTRAVLVQSSLPGWTLLSKLRRRTLIRAADHRQWLTMAASWLATFQRATLRPAGGVLDGQRALGERIYAHPTLSPRAKGLLLERLKRDGGTAWETACHGDFWLGNVLISEGRARVVDWSEYRNFGHPFHDAGFFLLTYGRDYMSLGRQRRPEETWLPAAFSRESRFSGLADHFLQQYCRLTGLGEAERVRAYLPLTMARYACYGQQARAWSAGCETWAKDPEKLFG
jgi:hypothetical protein